MCQYRRQLAKAAVSTIDSAAIWHSVRVDRSADCRGEGKREVGVAQTLSVIDLHT